MNKNHKVIAFSSPKGGTGTTTVAVLAALAADGRVAIVDRSQNRQVLAVIGEAESDKPVVSTMSPNVDVINDPELAAEAIVNGGGYDLVVIDRGVEHEPLEVIGDVENVIVTTRCYLALRKASATSKRFDSVVVVSDEDRVLTIGDVQAVLALPVVAVVPFDHSIARAVDAGVITTRASQFTGHLAGLLERVPA